KYVAPPAPKSTAVTATKKDAKLKAAAKPKPPVHAATVHHVPSHHPAVKEATAKPATAKQASPKPVPAKPASANQVASKTAPRSKWNPAPVVASAHVAPTHPVTVTAASGQKKPTAAIPNDTPQR